MGAIVQGRLSQCVQALTKINNVECFVETGTFRGGTTQWAATHFSTVHTIERSEGLYNDYNKRLRQLPGVTPHLGDSREVLPGVLQQIGDANILFWLDGHWSGGATAGEDDECPLMGELQCLTGREGDIILIDDARMFLSAPPAPHQASEWPTLVDIVHALDAAQGEIYMQVVDDVIIVVPDNELSRKTLTDYAQARSNQYWDNFLALVRGNKNP